VGKEQLSFELPTCCPGKKNSAPAVGIQKKDRMGVSQGQMKKLLKKKGNLNWDSFASQGKYSSPENSRGRGKEDGGEVFETLTASPKA